MYIPETLPSEPGELANRTKSIFDREADHDAKRREQRLLRKANCESKSIDADE